MAKKTVLNNSPTSFHTKHTLSIKGLMVLILLIMCLSAAALIFYHWQSAMKNGRMHIETIQDIQNQRALRTIANQLKSIANQINTITTLFQSSSDLEINNEAAIKQVLTTLIINSPNLATLSIANEENTYYSVFRPEGVSDVMYARATADGVMLSGEFSAWQNQPQDLQTNVDFFANKRPWFTQAINQQDLVWAPVYRYHSSGSYAIGASKSIALDQGKTTVVAADYLLNDLALMLRNIDDDQSAVLLLLDHEKNVIADNVSADDLQQQKLSDQLDDNKQQLMQWLDVADSPHQQLGDLLLSKQMINQAGINNYWLINVASESQLLASTQQKAQTFVWYSLVILTTTLLALYFLSRLLIRPVEQLELVSKEISEGRWDGEVPVSQIKEINNLSVAFQYMAAEVKSTLDNLESQVTKRTQRLQEVNDQLNQSNLTDPLTQIPNRRFFNQQMDHWFSKECELHLAIMDIDYFKNFNDQHGHLAGDQALITISSVIEQQFIDFNTDVARIGGEEFVAIYFGDGHKTFIDQLNKMQLKIKSQSIPFVDSEKPLSLSVSIGVAARLPGEKSWKGIYGRADKALYQAKADGRDRLVVD